MSNKEFKPNPGDVYRSITNVYRMYVKIPREEHLLCVNLGTGESYIHDEDNGISRPEHEEFVFSMANVVSENK
jgi:hypothetical protein